MDDKISFEVNGVAFQARRMDLMTQLAIVAKLGPMMAAGLGQILQLFDSVADEAAHAVAVTALTEPEAPSSAAMAVSVIGRIMALPKGRLVERLVPLAAEFAKMPPDDQKFVISTVLSTVQRNAGSASMPRWETIWPVGLPMPTAAEFRTDLMLSLRVVGTVLAATLGPFTPGSR